MNKGVFGLIGLLSVGGAMSLGCSSDNNTSGGTGGADSGVGLGTGGASTGGKGAGGASTGGKGAGGASTGGKGAGGSSTGGSSTGGSSTGGSSGSATDGGTPDASPDGGETDGGDGGPKYPAAEVARGAYLVHTVAQCGGCHTASGGSELAGNPLFKGGALPAPNLTSDATGVGSWTDEQIMNAFRNGVDDEGRHLDKAMPYWLFHNMNDTDASAIVAFLRSLPKVSTLVGDAAVGENNPDATPVSPISGFPASSLQAGDANYAAAQMGQYLLSSAAQCVRCHSPASAGLPAQSYFSGVAPASATSIFASNITPDATGIVDWTAADVATALKAGTNKAGTTLCGSMPSAAKGYGGLTDADAQAIGVYLTTIPAVSNAAAAPSLEPACP